ncbi:hypothetical protein IM697_18110 [Streptomyces ferrugineus]|uniref:Uncharacterized protein n=1 Tax=Streptomyces ferrugineus TaxID=1413221 RepID=A0A7M2SV47_9ACTN|nr:hypothetical protein [Streptomyces ferrugineus]QOV40142.1 hypothetical protein IM697_18110 [Streptomyces ferrugineus]
MADARKVAAEIQRLSRLSDDAFMDRVVAYVTGGTDRRVPRDVQGEAFSSPLLAPRTLLALETAGRRAKTYNPLQEGETKRQQQARIAPWRAAIKAAMGPIQDVVDDLAHEHAKELAALDDDAFSDRWTGLVLGEPVPEPTSPRVEELAFRSHRVARRTADICRLMLEDPAGFMPEPAPGESRTTHRRRVEGFRQRVQTEASFLRYAVQYADARQGRMPSEPNHRLQALKLLGQAHPQELLALLRQVRGEDRAAKQQERRDRRDIRRAARSGAQ